MNRFGDVSASILQAVITLAGLQERPSTLARVRAYIARVDLDIASIEEALEGALQEAGYLTTHGHILPGSLILDVNMPLLIVSPKGGIYRVQRLKKSSIVVLNMSTNSTHTIRHSELCSADGLLSVISVKGLVHSFLTSDASMQTQRGVSHQEPHSHHSIRTLYPFFRRILRGEKRDIVIIAVYSILTSLLGLVVPLSSQAIINSVALGVYNQQLVVLCLLVFMALCSLAFLTVFERYLIDMIQRRIFVSASFDIVYRLPLITQGALREQYGPELVNRFFDVMTIQKSLGKFFLDGINSVLILVTGLLLLGVYHPFFLLYDFMFLLFVPVLIFVLGRGGISAAIKVSKKKYATAAWLEDVARNQLAFKLLSASNYSFDRVDEVSTQYVEQRHKHFRIIARQVFGSYIFRAIATVGVLGLGGVLVIEQQISLGQLVAAEIVIIMILGALEKIVDQLDAFYDLVAALDKLSMITDQPLEEVGGLHVPTIPHGGNIICRNIQFSYDDHRILNGVNLNIDSGSRISLVGESGAGKTTLINLFIGLYSAHTGSIEVNGVDVRLADLTELRKNVGIVFPDNQIIPGTVLENITLGREFHNEDLQWALEVTMLSEDVRELPNGLNTTVFTSGENLSYGLRRRMMFARMILHKPNILFIDEGFDGIEDGVKLKMIDNIMRYDGWTVVNISHDPEIVRRTHYAYVLSKGVITEMGTPAQLCATEGSIFATLFPDPEQFDQTNGGKEL